jgi:hypothetical protein
MKTAGELRAEAEHWRDLARHTTDLAALEAIRELIEELEARAREIDDGAQANNNDPRA